MKNKKTKDGYVVNTKSSDAKFNQTKQALIDKLNDIFYNGDLRDIGNEIGFIIGGSLSKKEGFTKNDFIDGLNHGFSLKDGTH